jgi:hypothetical protein
MAVMTDCKAKATPADTTPKNVASRAGWSNQIDTRPATRSAAVASVSADGGAGDAAGDALPDDDEPDQRERQQQFDRARAIDAEQAHPVEDLHRPPPPSLSVALAISFCSGF